MDQERTRASYLQRDFYKRLWEIWTKLTSKEATIKNGKYKFNNSHLTIPVNQPINGLATDERTIKWTFGIA